MSCGGSLSDAVAALFGVAGGACGCGGPLFGYAAGKEVQGLSVSATDLAPLALPLEGVSKVRVLAVRSLDGTSLKLRLTSTNGGAAQVVMVSHIVVMHLPGVGDEVTAMSLSGTGRVDYLVAGEV